MNGSFSAANQAQLTERLIAARATDGWRWANPRSFDTGAEERMVLALPHVPLKGRILDLGAGLMAILPKLKIGADYTPVDLVKYAKTTQLLDLNNDQFPDGSCDCALALELLEHIHDVPALLTRVRGSAKRLVATYKSIEETGDKTRRRKAGYFNDFDRAALTSMLEAAGWKIEQATVHGAHTLFFCD